MLVLVAQVIIVQTIAHALLVAEQDLVQAAIRMSQLTMPVIVVALQICMLVLVALAISVRVTVRVLQRVVTGEQVAQVIIHMNQ
jgi:hypothetical protein